MLQERAAETEALRDEIVKRDHQVESLEKEISDLRNVVNEKEQLHSSSLDREKELEEQKAEVMNDKSNQSAAVSFN